MNHPTASGRHVGSFASRALPYMDEGYTANKDKDASGYISLQHRDRVRRVAFRCRSRGRRGSSRLWTENFLCWNTSISHHRARNVTVVLKLEGPRNVSSTTTTPLDRNTLSLQGLDEFVSLTSCSKRSHPCLTWSHSKYLLPTCLTVADMM